MSLKTVVFYGSVRSARQGIKAARFIVKKCDERGHDVALIDPLEYQLPLLDKMYKEYATGAAPETLRKMADLIIPADAYIVVSGEYNHTIPPALANLLDHFRSIPTDVVAPALRALPRLAPPAFPGRSVTLMYRQ